MSEIIEKSTLRAKTDRSHWLTEYLEPLTQCPLCGGTLWRPLFKVKVLTVHRCQQCQLMFLNPCLKPERMKYIFSSPELLQRVSSFFADYHDPKTWNTPRTLSIHRSVLQTIEKAGLRNGKLLDIGCGKGTFLRLAKERGWEAVGIEPNFEDAKELRELYGIKVYQNDFLEVSILEDKFDAVCLWDLIEHVPNPREWVMRCIQILKKGGLLVIATPDHFSLLDSLAELGYRLSGGRFTYALEKLYTIDHTLYFTKTTLKSLLEREGLEIFEVLKVNTDLSRYSMSAWFRYVAEVLLCFSKVLHWENRVIMIAKK